MSRFVMGVDGGGTKTEIVLIDSMGGVIGKIKVDSTNYQVVGEKVKINLIQGFEKLMKKTNVTLNKVDHIFLGLAGAGRKSDREEIKQLFQDTPYKDLITVDSDAIVALAGAFGTAPGIIIIAGTGAICFGKNQQGKIARSGGWGYLLGDEGSGYFIGREAIIAALKDFDGRGEKTELRQVVTKQFNLDSIEKIIPLIYKNKIDRIQIAGLAPLVFKTADKGDLIAEEIVKSAGKELGNLAKAVADRLGFTSDEVRVALIGSIFKEKEMLINHISKELYEISWNVTVSEPMFQPSYGAALMALQKIDVEITEFLLKNLSESIEKHVEI